MNFKDYLKIVLSPYVREKRLDSVVDSVYDSLLNLFKEEIVVKLNQMTLKELDDLRADILASSSSDAVRKDVQV